MSLPDPVTGPMFDSSCGNGSGPGPDVFWNDSSLVNTSGSVYVTIASSSLSVASAAVLMALQAGGVLSAGPCQFMFFSLTLADFLNAAGYLVGVIMGKFTRTPGLQSMRCNSSLVCVAQSFVTTTCSMAGFLWTIVIEVGCFLIIWRAQHRLHLPARAKAFLCLICWGLPLAISIAAVSERMLGTDRSRTSAGWCWIVSCRDLLDSTRSDCVATGIYVMWMLLAGKLWEFLSYLTIANLMFLQLFRYYRREQDFLRQFSFGERSFRRYGGTESTADLSRRSSLAEEEAEAEKPSDEVDECKFLFWIPAAMLLVRVWGTLRFIITVVQISRRQQTAWLQQLSIVFLYIQGFGDCSQATCNLLLALIFRREVRSALNPTKWRARRRNIQ